MDAVYDESDPEETEKYVTESSFDGNPSKKRTDKKRR